MVQGQPGCWRPAARRSRPSPVGIPRWLLSRPPRWLKAAPLHCCRLPRHRLTTPRLITASLIAAPLCYTVALPRRSAVLRLPLPLLPTVALLLRRRSVTAPLLPLIVAPLRILPRRRAPRRACCRTASLLRPRRSAAAVLLPPQPLLLLPRRSSTLPRCSRSAPLRVTLLHAASSAPRRLAAAALLRCCRGRFATATPQRVLLSDSKTCLQMKTGDQNHRSLKGGSLPVTLQIRNSAMKQLRPVYGTR